MKQLTSEENKSHIDKINSYIFKEEFGNNNDINRQKVRNHC